MTKDQKQHRSAKDALGPGKSDPVNLWFFKQKEEGDAGSSPEASAAGKDPSAAEVAAGVLQDAGEAVNNAAGAVVDAASAEEDVASAAGGADSVSKGLISAVADAARKLNEKATELRKDTRAKLTKRRHPLPESGSRERLIAPENEPAGSTQAGKSQAGKKPEGKKSNT